MKHALMLARRGLGRVAPNPSVGCVIVARDGHIVGRGWTQPGGRPHAETEALRRAGSLANGATAYVTLEPCSHQGETPPCADALVAAGVACVVGAIEDPDSRVSGRGFERLRKAGVHVRTGVCADAAEDLNAGFLLRVREGRPLVTLKIAQSLDGETAPSGGDKWITGPEARRFGHLLRAQNDAILIGSETALADDPELTCRIPGLENRSPLRIVLDARGRLRPSSKIARTAKRTPTLVFTADPKSAAALSKCGVELVAAKPSAEGRIDITAMLKELGRRGVTRLLVEGGRTVQSSFLRTGMADRLELFTAPLILGSQQRNAAAVVTKEAPREMQQFVRIGQRRLGPDLLESFVRKA